MKQYTLDEDVCKHSDVDKAGNVAANLTLPSSVFLNISIVEFCHLVARGRYSKAQTHEICRINTLNCGLFTSLQLRLLNE